MTRKHKLAPLAIVSGGIIGGLVIAMVISVAVSSRHVDAQQRSGKDMTYIALDGDPAVGFQRATSLAGFEVRQPKFLPVGDTLTEINFASDVKASRHRAVAVAARGANGGFLLSETDATVAAPASALPLTTAVKGLRAWALRDGEASTYLAIGSDGRSYVLMTQSKSTLTDADALAVLEGVAAN